MLSLTPRPSPSQVPAGKEASPVGLRVWRSRAWTGRWADEEVGSGFSACLGGRKSKVHDLLKMPKPN